MKSYGYRLEYTDIHFYPWMLYIIECKIVRSKTNCDNKGNAPPRMQLWKNKTLQGPPVVKGRRRVPDMSAAALPAASFKGAAEYLCTSMIVQIIQNPGYEFMGNARIINGLSWISHGWSMDYPRRPRSLFLLCNCFRPSIDFIVNFCHVSFVFYFPVDRRKFHFKLK